ncbi:MAG: hypothetical protein ACKN9E_07455 [Microcystaceae cyanobacterium]
MSLKRQKIQDLRKRNPGLTLINLPEPHYPQDNRQANQSQNDPARQRSQESPAPESIDNHCQEKNQGKK